MFVRSRPCRVFTITFMAIAAISLLNAGRAYGDQWANVYGGPLNDRAYSLQQTADGGYVTAGISISYGPGGGDGWVLKFDPEGAVEWQKAYGESLHDELRSIGLTADSGYIAAGVTRSSGEGGADFWVLKLDAGGDVEWQNTYGGVYNDFARDIQPTADEGYIVAGSTLSFGAGSSDLWLLKLAADGSVEWQKTYGGPYDDQAYSLRQTADEGYIVVGTSLSFGSFNSDCWVLKLDGDGNIEWQNIYGGLISGQVGIIEEDVDGGYVLAGKTKTYGAGRSDGWILKIDSEGSVEWQKAYGGRSNDEIRSIMPIDAGGYVVAGETRSFGSGGKDGWLLKLDGDGNVEWQRTYGGFSDDAIRAVQPLPEGGYIAAGETGSYGAGGIDLWLLKLDDDGQINYCSASGVSYAIVTEADAEVTETEASIEETEVSPLEGAAVAEDTEVEESGICFYTDVTFTITASAGANGTIDPAGEVEVGYLESQAFAITADEGYEVDDVLVDGSSVGAVTAYTFYGVTEDHTIEAGFSVKSYAILATSSDHGSIDPSGEVEVEHGGTQTFTMTADEGCFVEDVVIDGSSEGPMDSYTFVNVIEDHRIRAIFGITTFTITATADGNGAIFPSGEVEVEYGADQTFQIKPYTGSYVEDVVVDGISVGAVDSYTFTAVLEDHTIDVTFGTETYTITASAGDNGTIDPSGEIIVDGGHSQTFTITADEDYYIEDVVVDGISVGAVSSYTFYNVTDDHTIEASFVSDPVTFTISPPEETEVSPGSFLGPFSMSITNNTDADYSLHLYIYLGSADGRWPLLRAQTLTLSTGETVEMTDRYLWVPPRAPSGTHYFWVNVYNTEYEVVDQAWFTFEVSTASTAPALAAPGNAAGQGAWRILTFPQP